MGKKKTKPTQNKTQNKTPQLQGTVENKWNLSTLICGRLLDVLFCLLVGEVGGRSWQQPAILAVCCAPAHGYTASSPNALGTHCSACPCSQSVVREGRMCVVSLPFIFCQLKRLCCSMRISPPGCGLFTAHRAGSGVSRGYARALLQLYVSVRREKCSVLIWQ